MHQSKAREDGDWPIDHRMPYAYGDVVDRYDNYGHDKSSLTQSKEWEEGDQIDRRMPLNAGWNADYYDTHGPANAVDGRSVEGRYAQMGTHADDYDLVQLENPVLNPPFNNWSVNQPSAPHDSGMGTDGDLGLRDITVDGVNGFNFL